MLIKNKIQKELFLFLNSNSNSRKSFTPEYLHMNVFRDYSIRQIKYNLTKLEKMDIGIEEEYVCIHDSGYCYSNGYYCIKK